MIPLPRHNIQRKSTLIAFGHWAILTGRGWLVRAVRAAIEREALRHV